MVSRSFSVALGVCTQGPHSIAEIMLELDRTVEKLTLKISEIKSLQHPKITQGCILLVRRMELSYTAHHYLHRSCFVGNTDVLVRAWLLEACVLMIRGYTPEVLQQRLVPASDGQWCSANGLKKKANYIGDNYRSV